MSLRGFLPAGGKNTLQAPVPAAFPCGSRSGDRRAYKIQLRGLPARRGEADPACGSYLGRIVAAFRDAVRERRNVGRRPHCRWGEVVLAAAVRGMPENRERSKEGFGQGRGAGSVQTGGDVVACFISAWALIRANTDDTPGCTEVPLGGRGREP